VATPQTLLDGAFARRLERLTLASRKRLIGQGQGDRRSLRKGSSLEFADYRHYVEGDDPARVDWNIYSRTDQLFMRLYEEEEVLNVHLLVDASSRRAGRSSEVVVMHTLSPQELRPTLGGDVRLIDRESGAAVSVTLNNDAIRLYGQRLADWRHTIESFCARHGMGYVPLDTAVPIESLVFDVLRRRGVVR
jgi:hypothetical protein